MEILSRHWALLIMSIVLINIYAMEEPPHGNPLRQLDYKQAFDQTVLYSQYHDLLTELHCDANVSLEEDEESSCDCSVDPVTLGKKGYRFFRNLLGDRRLAQRQKFERACLEKLADARQDVILKGGKNAAISMGLSVAATVGLTKWLTSPESFGGSFAMFNTSMGAVHYTKDIVRSIAELQQPHQRIDDLEKTYAINKCFIPRTLWEKIEKNFEYARRGDDHQASYIEFLEFALHFTTLRPQQPIEIDSTHTIHTLFERIDNFLSAYNVTPWQLSLLKINIRNFVENVAGTANHPMRYVYLVGEGGIGKSEFVEQLHHWLEELAPDSIHFNKKTIETAAELEGGAATKGILLKTFGEQLAHGKRGSVILLDDAEWFKSDGSIASAAKRVFNGNLAEIQTTYFSQCDSDTGLKLPMPPMLVFVTSNSEIKDEALAERFDIIHFPSNEQDALKSFALELCATDREYQQADYQTQTAIREQFMHEISCGKTIENTPMKTFRDVKLHVAPLCFYMTHTCVTHTCVTHACGAHTQVPHDQPRESVGTHLKSE